MNVQSRGCVWLMGTCIVFAGCVTSDPTDTPGVRTIGEETVVYDGPELSMSINTREAARTVGGQYLVLEVSLGGRSTSRMLTVERGDVFIRTPDRRTIPMMTQNEFSAAYGQLVGAAMRVEFQPAGRAVTSHPEAPCVDWYFRRPFDGLAREQLTISPFRPCWGPLFFHVPGGVQPGRWELEIRLDESTAEVPFHLGSR